MKVDILDFEERMNLDDFIEWMQAFERIFEYKELPVNRKVMLAAIKLKKYLFVVGEYEERHEDKVRARSLLGKR